MPGESAEVPRHVAIIMDGNGRWARQRGLPRVEGHREGAESVRSVVRAARALGGIETLTLFAFSEQNWERPPDEVEALMTLLHQYLLEERDEIMDNDIRLTAVGDLARLPSLVQRALQALIDYSAQNSSMELCLALSYGGREDIVHAARKLASDVQRGALEPAAVDEVAFIERLQTRPLPPIDLLIRTSGEHRVSNFMLWHLAYAELVFTETMWPDFRKQQLLDAVAEYQHRERRFGRLVDRDDRADEPRGPDAALAPRTAGQSAE